MTKIRTAVAPISLMERVAEERSEVKKKSVSTSVLLVFLILIISLMYFGLNMYIVTQKYSAQRAVNEMNVKIQQLNRDSEVIKIELLKAKNIVTSENKIDKKAFKSKDQGMMIEVDLSKDNFPQKINKKEDTVKEFIIIASFFK